MRMERLRIEHHRLPGLISNRLSPPQDMNAVVQGPSLVNLHFAGDRRGTAHEPIPSAPFL